MPGPIQKASVLTVIAGLATGCASSTFGEHPLTRHEWSLYSISTASGSIELTGAQRDSHTLRFGADGDLTLRLDCNNGVSSWTASRPSSGNGTLTISEIGSTRALCAPQGYGETLASALPSASQYTLLPDGRSMTIVTEEAVFAFVSITD